MKFSSNKNINVNKFKPIPVTTANVRKENKGWSVHTACLSCFWDTKASHCVINQNYAKNFREDFRHNYITYKTSGGDYKTKYDINIDFTLPEFSETKIINHWFHINSSKDKNIGYGIIIGQDIMKKLGIIVDFGNKNLMRYNFIITMWRSGANITKPALNWSEIKQVMKQTGVPKVTRKTTEIIIKILDSK